MTTKALAEQIQKWVRLNCREDEEVEIKETDWKPLMLAVKPQKSNWTKAAKLAEIVLVEHDDVLDHLIGKVWDDAAMEPWVSKLKVIKEDVSELRKRIDQMDEKEEPVRASKRDEDEDRAGGARINLKKPEIQLPSQNNDDVLEYYAAFMDSISDLEILEKEAKILFKQGLNSAHRKDLISGGVKIQAESLEKQVKYLAEVHELKASKLMKERDALYQRAEETPFEFLGRWNRLALKGKVMGVEKDMDMESAVLFISRLRGSDVLSSLITETRLHKICAGAGPLQIMMGSGKTNPRKAQTPIKPSKAEKSEDTSSKEAKKKGVQCHNCRKWGHIRRDCPELKKKNQAQGAVLESWKGSVGGKPVNVYLDSCAQVSCVGDKAVRELVV